MHVNYTYSSRRVAVGVGVQRVFCNLMGVTVRRVGRGAPRRGAAPRASAPRLKRAPRASAPRAPQAVSGPCCPGKRSVPVCKPEMDWRLRLQRAVTRCSLRLCFCPATRNYTKLQPAVGPK